jgi:hypothetical protein
MIQVQTQEIIKQGKSQSKLTKTVVLNPQETVFFVMDMWDKHWCDQVNNTIQPLADKINETIKKCREKGITHYSHAGRLHALISRLSAAKKYDECSTEI